MTDSSQGGSAPHNPYGGQGSAGENPYGQPPGQPSGPPSGQQPAADPYGRPPASEPYAQPPASNPYAQPPASNPYAQQQPQTYGAYGSQYGQPPAGPLGDGLDMYGRPLGSDERPGSVTGAGWTTLILSGLAALFFGVLTLALLVAKDTVIDAMQEEMARSGTYDFQPEDAYGVILAIFIVLTIWCVIACVLAVFTMRRSNVARILLVISSVVACLVTLPMFQSLLSLIWTAGTIAVVVMLFTGGANAWFAGRRRY